MNKPAYVRHHAAFGEPAIRPVIVLAVGDGFSNSDACDAASRASTAFTDYADVGAELIHALRPQVVISSMLARNFDCVDLAERLVAIGFEGTYRLIGHGIPEPELVVRELQSLFPGLKVDLAADV
jgi:hypothetical protein